MGEMIFVGYVHKTRQPIECPKPVAVQPQLQVPTLN